MADADLYKTPDGNTLRMLAGGVEIVRREKQVMCLVDIRTRTRSWIESAAR